MTENLSESKMHHTEYHQKYCNMFVMKKLSKEQGNSNWEGRGFWEVIEAVRSRPAAHEIECTLLQKWGQNSWDDASLVLGYRNTMSTIMVIRATITRKVVAVETFFLQKLLPCEY